MPFFTSKQETQRSTVAALLQALDNAFPGLVGRLTDRSGLAPATIGRLLGETLAAERYRLESTLTLQARQIEVMDKNVSDFLAKNQATPTAAMQRELAAAKAEAGNWRLKFLNAEHTIQELERQRAQASAWHACQVEQLQAELADHKRLIARQHLELVDLMGDSYAPSNQPPAELPG